MQRKVGRASELATETYDGRGRRRRYIMAAAGIVTPKMVIAVVLAKDWLRHIGKTMVWYAVWYVDSGANLVDVLD